MLVNKYSAKITSLSLYQFRKDSYTKKIFSSSYIEMLPPINPKKNILLTNETGEKNINTNNVQKRITMKPIPQVKSSQKCGDIPNLPMRRSSLFKIIFLEKVNFCTKKYDQCKLNKNFNEQKTTHLEQIFSSMNWIATFDEELLKELFGMLEANIVRDNISSVMVFDSIGDLDPIDTLAHSKKHLFLCYDILIKIAKMYQTFPSYGIDLLYKLSNIFETPDPIERGEIIKLFAILGNNQKMESMKTFNNMNDLLIEQMANKNNPYAISTILGIMENVIYNMGLGNEIVVKTFRLNLIPLLRHELFHQISENYGRVVFQILNNKPFLTLEIFEDLHKYWPHTNIAKQYSFIVMLEKFFPLLSDKEQGKFMKKTFTTIAKYSNSMSEIVAKNALSIWKNNFYRTNFLNNKKIVPIFFPSIKKAAEEHWSNDVRELSTPVLSLLNKIDQSFAKKAEQNFTDEKIADFYRRKKWIHIVKTASKKDHSLDISGELGKISKEFELIAPIRIE